MNDALIFIRQVVFDFWVALTVMSPYLLFGFLVAGILSVLISTQMVQKHLGGSSLLSVFKASLFGVPLPLCSCGVIPVSMSLSSHGAGKPAIISFLISTPQTGIDSIMVSWSLLGPVFALYRPVVAFITGIVGGIVTKLFNNKIPSGPVSKSTSNTDLQNSKSNYTNTADKLYPKTVKDDKENCRGHCCSDAKRSRIKRILKHGFYTLPADIAKPILLGLFIAALLSVAIPEDFFASKLGQLGQGLPIMILMLFIGIPVYVCSAASVPVAAVLIYKGLSPGAAMVFLMSGPATNAITFVTVWNKLGKKTAVSYILTVAVGAIIAGLTLDALFPSLAVTLREHAHKMSPNVLEHLSAILLLAVLFFAMYKKHIRQKQTSEKQSES
jgi:hypothetical protein